MDITVDSTVFIVQCDVNRHIFLSIKGYESKQISK